MLGSFICRGCVNPSAGASMVPQVLPAKPQHSLHGGLSGNLSLSPRWHSMCHPHQPRAGTDGWSGDSVAQPPHASSQAAEGGPGGPQPQPAGSGSSQEPTSCCISRDGCRTSPRTSTMPVCALGWRIKPQTHTRRLVLFHPSLGEQGLAKNPSLISAGAPHLWKYLYFNPYTRPTCNQSNTNSPCFPCKLKTPIRQISKDVSRLIIIHDILPR